jgi:hypothetical protein
MREAKEELRVVRFLSGLIRSLRRLCGRKAVSQNQADMNADYFVRSGCEYYASARFGMYAQQSYICGTLFHHSVEMLLKAGLAKKGQSLDELRRLGHDLKRLWRAYKSEYGAGELERHNGTINALNKYEDIRYPNPDLGSIGVGLQWSGEPGEVKTFGGLKTPKQYHLVVAKIDDLVADIFRTSSWNPGVFIGRSEPALEAIKRNNAQAEFLTSLISPGGAKS